RAGDLQAAGAGVGAPPAKPPGAVFPLGRVARMFSAGLMVGFVATVPPGRQCPPLAGMRRRACIATTARPADSTASASSVDRDCSTVLIVTSVTGGRQCPHWCRSMGGCRVERHRPNGRGSEPHFERLEPLQVFDKILLLLVAEAQLEERVVMGHHIEQRREATVV